MPSPYTGTRIKRCKWARYNARRRADREADRLMRQARRAQRQADADARLLAECERPIFLVPKAIRPTPTVNEMRVTLEIDGVRRVFRASCIDGLGWIGDSGNLITRAIRVIMRHAPIH